MKQRVLDYIMEFGSITSMEAFKDLGCTRLSECIRQLRETMTIDDEWESTINRFGEKVEYKRYFIGGKDEATN